MDTVEQRNEAKKKLTIDLKENLTYQLLARRCPVRIDTLKNATERAVPNVGRYADLDDALNELIKEDKVTLHLIGEGELYFSAK